MGAEVFESVANNSFFTDLTITSVSSLNVNFLNLICNFFVNFYNQKLSIQQTLWLPTLLRYMYKLLILIFTPNLSDFPLNFEN